jgi:hypothetical protein
MAQPLPWWVERLVIPVIFALVGAGIGFGAGQVTAWLERRRTKRTFLRAIRLELLGLREQLQASLDEVEASKERLQRNIATPPHLVGTIRNTVFNSQLGRISDLSDPLIIEIIKLYSDLPVLLQIIGALNQHSMELSKDDGSAQQAQRIRAVLSIVIALSVQFNGFLTRIHGLVERLPGDALDSSARKDQSKKSRAG